MKLLALAPVLGLGVSAMVWVAASTTAQQSDVASPSEEIMWRKLDLAHDSLDALALDDFEALHAYAEDLVMLAEASERYGPDTDAYKAESARFRAAAVSLGEAADERNVSAGAIAYAELTLACIRCHRRFGAVLPR